MQLRPRFALTKKKFCAELDVGVDFLLLYNEDASHPSRRLVDSISLPGATFQEKVPAQSKSGSPKLIIRDSKGHKWRLSFNDERDMKEWHAALKHARDFSASADRILQQWRDAGCAPSCTSAQIESSTCVGGREEQSMEGCLFFFFLFSIT